jgi:hypothetical protein
MSVTIRVVLLALVTLGNMTKMEPVIVVLPHPRLTRLVVKSDIYGTTDSYATNVTTAKRVIYTGRYFCEKCL